jgi:hypothetical protein
MSYGRCWKLFRTAQGHRPTRRSMFVYAIPPQDMQNRIDIQRLSVAKFRFHWQIIERFIETKSFLQMNHPVLNLQKAWKLPLSRFTYLLQLALPSCSVQLHELICKCESLDSCYDSGWWIGTWHASIYTEMCRHILLPRMGFEPMIPFISRLKVEYSVAAKAPD